MENQRLTDSLFIAELLRRQAQGETLTEEETAQLTSWSNRHKVNEQLHTRLKDPEELAKSILELDQSNTDIQLQRFNQRLQQKKRSAIIYKVAAIAAVALLIISVGIYQWKISQNMIDKNPVTAIADNADALPATKRATLTLSNGEVLTLREDQIGIVADGRGISYQDGKRVEKISDVSYATLSTPRGGQYQITLSDGSKVSLNAGSSLEYPLQFTGNERIVTLKGEGYFEVAHHSDQPFIVHTANQKVRVYGTIFNIQAYSAKERTTLLTGSVAVSSSGSSSETRLKPNMQAVVTKGNITLRKVDVSDYTGWKEGRFQADLITLSDLSEDIERWYDVKFIFAANYNNTDRALISINRHEKLSKVLKTLELTYNVHFRIEGREVHIQ